MTAKPTRLTTAFYSGTALSLALGAALLASSLPARAAGEGESLESRVIRNILEGVGLQKDSEEINYGERAPLVIPPSSTLPPPESSDAAVARNPAWPKDPDVARRKAEAARERNRNISAEREHEQDRLRPDELTPGASPKTRQAHADDGYQSPASGFSNPLSPSELGSKSNFFGNLFGKSKNEEVANFTKEPPRTALTEPPAGYRTPSPDQPYGLSKATTAPRATNYLEEHGTVDGGR